MAERLAWFRRNRDLLIVALVAYLPIIASSPGRVGADTKTYLYLDPGRVLTEATTMWDADVALGTVTHQNIGYLWPMGPFYWVFDTLGSPDWFAQRIWLGSLLFAAAAGVRYLLRTLDWHGGGLLVAMLAYELTPYLLDYSARISAVLLPWAGLPWMIALTIRAARTQGWRHPALFALLVVTVGSVNATSLLLVGIAPVLWLGHAVWIERSLGFVRALAVAVRIGGLTAGVSLWWIAGLVLQGGYSLPVTRYTETYQTVASASTAPEVLRGLGYWFFYGHDKFGQWIEPSIEYTQGVWLIFVSYGLVVLALLGAALVRWRYRSYFVLLIVVGGLIAVGSHPFDAPSPLGSRFKEFTTTDAGLALRSTPRALPMLVLGTSVLLAALINALQRRWPGWGRAFASVVVVAIMLNNPAMWRIRMIEEHLHRDEDIPEYWLEAIEALDANGNEGRVMELPGTDFASYRWGNTVDPITPGFLDRGYVARELVPFGSNESAALLTAFDRRFQEDTVEAGSIVPVAQLMSVDDIVHRADLTFERFRTPRPVPTADLLDNRAGLGSGIGFGEPVPNIAGPEQTMRDEVFLAISPDLADPSPVTAYPVPEALDIVRLRATTGATVLVGDAEGVVDAAGAGLVDTTRPLWFGADLAGDDELREQVLEDPATIVITDTNRRTARRWGTLRENVGHVEQADEVPLVDDPTDNRLELFPEWDGDPDIQTVSRQPGPFILRATEYGNPVTYTNDDRPAHAIDGDTQTAWVVGAFAEARGERLVFTYPEPVELDEITFVQPQGEANRHVTEVAIRAAGTVIARPELGPDSRTEGGQRVDLPSHGSTTVYEVELTDLSLGEQPTYPGVSPVGFAEVRMGAAPPVVEALRTPVAFVGAVGADLDRHDLAVVLTRQRSNPQEPVRADPEAEIRRDVVVPVARQFDVEGTARLSAAVPESALDALIGRAAAIDGSGLVARSSGRLPGDLRSGASFAFDGDEQSAWTGVFGAQAGQWLELTADAPIPIDEIRLDVVVDADHSVPTLVELQLDGESFGRFSTGMALADRARGSYESVTIAVGRRAAQVRLIVVEAQERPTRDWYSGSFTAMPIAIAELDLGGDQSRFGPPTGVDTGCLPLLIVDGAPRSARVVGDVDAALERHALGVKGCDRATTAGGEFTVETTGRAHGLDVDQLVLRSPRPLEAASAPPEVTVIEESDTELLVSVPARDAAHWLVLGQSFNDGWAATVEGQSLGEPTLIDAFANGWLLPPGESTLVRLEWEPQALVGRALWASVAAIIATLLLAGLGHGRERPLMPTRGDGPEQPELVPLPLLGASPPVGGPSRLLSARWGPAMAAGVAAGLFAVVNLPRWPAASIAVAASVVLAARRPRLWLNPALVGALALGVAALSIMIDQRRFRFPPGFGWPQQFADVHVLGVLCLLLLFADCVVAAVRPDRDERD